MAAQQGETLPREAADEQDLEGQENLADEEESEDGGEGHGGADGYGPNMQQHVQEPTFWYDTGLMTRDRMGGAHQTQAQLIRKHENRWLPFTFTCCRRRPRGIARLEEQRARQSSVLSQRLDSARGRAARGDPSVVELDVATLGGNSLGTVPAAAGTTGADLRASVAALAQVPEEEVELVMANSSDTVVDHEAVVPSPAAVEELRSASPPHLHMVRVKRTLAVSGATDGSVTFWDASRQAPLQQLVGHTQRVQCVEADFAARRAVTGASDGTLKLWDLDSARCVESIIDYTGDFHCASTDWVGRRSLGGLSNGTLAMWDLDTGSCQLALHRGHYGPVQCVDAAWGQGKAMSGSTEGGVMLWDLETCTRTPMQGHMVWVADVKVDPDARFAVSGSIDGMLRIWDLRANLCARSMQGRWSDVKCLSVFWGGAKILTGAGNSALNLWDVASGRMEATLTHPSDEKRRDTNCISVDWAARRALSGTAAGELMVWDLDRLECVETWEAHNAQIKCVALAQTA